MAIELINFAMITNLDCEGRFLRLNPFVGIILLLVIIIRIV